MSQRKVMLKDAKTNIKNAYLLFILHFVLYYII